MERHLSIEQINTGVLKEGKNAYGEVITRLYQMLKEAKIKSYRFNF